MNILALLLSVFSTCLADPFAFSSYAFPQHTNHFTIQTQPALVPESSSSSEATTSSYSSLSSPSSTFFEAVPHRPLPAPRKTSFVFPQQAPKSLKTSSRSLSSSKSIFPPLPKRFISPKFFARASSYSEPKKSYSEPKISYAVPKRSYSEPKSSYAVPKRSYSEPKSSYAVPKRSYSEPKRSYAVPKRSYSAPTKKSYKPVVPILQDEREQNDDGSYSFSVLTGDGVKRQEKGIPVYSKEGAGTAIAGSYSYILPDGQLFEMRYIADENGFQPQSNYVPVVPDFPHPIPAHALEQIERGRREHEARERKDRLKKQKKTVAGASKGGYSKPSRPGRKYSLPSSFSKEASTSSYSSL